MKPQTPAIVSRATDTREKDFTARLTLLALGLILAGGAGAWLAQTNAGTVRIEDVRFEGPGGITQNARLYVPPGVSAATPAPGIVAIHGYINTHETQAGFAIEFARRGWVVLAADQTGHGFSDPPSGANGFGGPPALAYLRSLDMVDPDNIGLEGHSMGGWASLAAAAAMPDGYRALVLEGSSVGTVAPVGDAGALRNVAVVFSLYDEFSALMWGAPVPADVVASERLKALFGIPAPADRLGADADATDGPAAAVVRDSVYGSVSDGSARILHQPPVTHPGDHLSRAAIGYAIDWFQLTLRGGNGLPSSNQIWYWKEFGTLTALVGMVILFFPTGHWLLGVGGLAHLAGPPTPTRAASGAGWWVAAVLFVALPPLTLFPFKDLFGVLGLSATARFPQTITTQIVLWSSLTGLVSSVLFGIWHRANRRRGATVDDYGLTWSGRPDPAKIGASLAVALGVVATGYATLVLSALVFKTDYRFWVFAVRPMNFAQFRIGLSYLLPFTAFFLVLGTVLHGQLRRDGLGLGREMLLNVTLLASGFAALLVWQYVPLLAGGTLADPTEPLWTIIAFQFLPLMTIVGLVSTYFFRTTGHIWVGAFTNGLLVTWIVVASQATQFG